MDGPGVGGAAQHQLDRRAARPHRRHAAPGRPARRRHRDAPEFGADGGRHRWLCADKNVTDIVIGKSRRSRWFELLHGLVVHDLVRRSGNISVHVIAGEDAMSQSRREAPRHRSGENRFHAWPFALTVPAVAVALGVALLIEPYFGVENVDLVFLTIVVAVPGPPRALSIAPGRYPIVSCLQFLLHPTLLHLHHRRPEERRRAVLLHRRHRPDLQSGLQVPHGRRDLPNSGAGQRGTVRVQPEIGGVRHPRRRLVGNRVPDRVHAEGASGHPLPEPGGIAVQAGDPPEDAIDQADVAAAKWAFDNNRPAGRGADTLPGAKRLFLPMRTGRGVIGVVGIDADKPGPILHAGTAASPRCPGLIRARSLLSACTWSRRSTRRVSMPRPTGYGRLS